MSRLLDSLRPPMETAPEMPPDSDPDPLMDLPAFQQPRTLPGPASPDPAGPDLTTRPTGDSDATGAGSGSNDDQTSIPGFFKARAKSYAKIAEALVESAGGWLNRASGEEDSGAFLPDEDDIATIPPPLGRLAARRIKLGDPGKLSDLEDIGMAAVGTLVWVAKGFTAVMNARRERRRIEKAVAMHQDEGTGQ